MTKLSAIPRGRRLLFLGASGTGKTHLIGTLCELLPTIVVTSDKDTLETLASMGLDPEVILIENWYKIVEYERAIVAAASTHRAIAIDDLGSIQGVALDKVLKMARLHEEKEARTRPKEFKEQVWKDILLGERRLRYQSGDWPSLFTAVDTFISDILNMPFEVKLVTALEAIMSNPRDGEDRIYPNLGGGIRTVTPAHFSLVGELFIATHDGSQHYCATCRSHPRIETKTRYGEGRTWVDPTMAKILAYIVGRGGEESTTEKGIGTGLPILETK